MNTDVVKPDELKTIVRWGGNQAFSYQSTSGHEGWVDAAAKDGGPSLGPSPMELIVCGLGGCTAYDVVHILKKSRQAVTGCEAQLKAQRATTVPAVFDNIHIHFIVTGQSLNKTQVERAVALSAEKYCSASIMLERGGVVITHSVDVVEEND